jgi:phosphate transport system substrate-binding protein
MKKIRLTGKILAVSLTLTFLLTACTEDGGSGAGTAGSGRTVELSGSTSVQPFAEVLAAEYENFHGGSPVDVQGGGSTNGIRSARSGVADIGMSSRKLGGDELELEHVVIALDGLALIVHPDNTLVNNLTMEQIRGIYAREITCWSEVGGVAGAIHAVSREEGSGTRGAFETDVMRELVSSFETHEVPVPPCENCEFCEECADEDGNRTVMFEREVITEVHHHIHARTIVLNTNGAIRQFVAGNSNAIGYISLGTVEIEGLPPVKAVSIDNGNGPVAPTAENVLSEVYSLARPFILIIGEDPMPETRNFINFVLSNEGQEVLGAYGLVRGLDATGLPFESIGGES